MADIILHHYPQSPVSEKVRVTLGMKKAVWRSVEIPRLPPKPDLMPLTGGYRRTPVLQVGADIYCDSQCIIRELERRVPNPTLYPNGAAGLPWALSRWTDGALFTMVVSVVMGAQAGELPEAFAADRGRLYLGPNFDWQVQKKDLPTSWPRSALSSDGWRHASPAVETSCSARIRTARRALLPPVVVPPRPLRRRSGAHRCVPEPERLGETHSRHRTRAPRRHGLRGSSRDCAFGDTGNSGAVGPATILRDSGRGSGSAWRRMWMAAIRPSKAVS